MSNAVIELKVRNHPGVMSHITGLFARRAFNLEGILCGPVGDGSESRMYLLVNGDNRLKQMMANLENLYDVREVLLRRDVGETAFNRLLEVPRPGALEGWEQGQTQAP